MWEEMLEVRQTDMEVFLRSLWTSAFHRCVEDEKDETLLGESDSVGGEVCLTLLRV